MEFIKGYMDDPKYRHLLNDMTQEIFEFTFEPWYCAGYYAGEYIPYSYIENEKIIANASANIMKMFQNGEEKFYIQIGTVMTRPEYRNRGLARQLIQRILQDYESMADGFYLYGNLNAVGFYERLGFSRLDQFRYSLKQSIRPKIGEGMFLQVGKSYREEYINTLQNSVSNAALDQLNRCSLQLFYTMKMENVYYCKNLDCFAVIERHDEDIHLISIVSKKAVSVLEVLKRIGEYKNAILGFAPKAEDMFAFDAQPFDGGNEYRFFYKGSQLRRIAEDKLYFPIMSHA